MNIKSFFILENINNNLIYKNVKKENLFFPFFEYKIYNQNQNQRNGSKYRHYYSYIEITLRSEV